MKTGLRQRPTFEGIVNYLPYGQETIRYPDRLAKIIRNHPYLTQLDGEGMMEMQEQIPRWKSQCALQQRTVSQNASVRVAGAARAERRELVRHVAS